MTAPHTVGLLIFDDVEVLDFCGPFEVFSLARLPGQEDVPLFQALIIAEERRTIRCRGGLLVQPHGTIADHPPLDILLVPGGAGARRERGNRRLLDWIRAQDRRSELMTSVCTGAFLLAEAGILAGRRATTHWASIDWMRQTYADVTILSETRIVDEGHVVTSAGVSAGIDMALALVARLHGPVAAAWTARRMEYGPAPLV